MITTALKLAPRYVVKLAAAVEEFLPHVGPGEGKLQEEMSDLLTGLTEAVKGFQFLPSMRSSDPQRVEGEPVLIDLTNTVDLGWGTLGQVVEEWDTTSPEAVALVRLFNAAEGHS